MRIAIEASGMPDVVRGNPDAWPNDVDAVDSTHRLWARAITEQLDEIGVANATYGRAAKLIAIYLKAMVVAGTSGDLPFAKHAHPPVDRVLLQALSRDAAFAAEHRRLWRETRWTQLSEESYFALVATFRTEGLDQPTFWQIERYWQPELASG